ncbi:hypothetical protein [Caballeronia pedi]|uniref:hypothetical protein n=1 Tax=Caballeronia pedi TaxID=1777141 RepID=UPI000B14F962|nr:hypothetical protein [Caballeronia pedi]
MPFENLSAIKKPVSVSEIKRMKLARRGCRAIDETPTPWGDCLRPVRRTEVLSPACSVLCADESRPKIIRSEIVQEIGGFAV